MLATNNTALKSWTHSSSSPLSSQKTSTSSSSISDTSAQFQQEAASQSMADSVQQRAQDDPAAFREALQQAFGGKASPAALDALMAKALSGNLPLPANVQFVDAGTLGANSMGAYDSANGGTIYLDSRLLNDSQGLEAVFTEELGHHLDAELGGQDAAGDEGAIFSDSLLKGKLGDSELGTLKSENDNGFINVDNKRIAVEFNGYSGPGSSEATGGSSSSSSGGSSSSSGGSSSSSSSGNSSSGGSSTSSSSGGSSSGGSSSSSSSGGSSSSSSGNNSSSGSSSSYSGPGSSVGTGGSGNSSSSSSGNSSSYGNPASYSGPGSTFETGGSDNFSAASRGSAHAYFSPGSSIGIDAIAATRPPEDEDDPSGFSAARDLTAELAASGLSLLTNNTPLPDLTPEEAREFLAEDQDRAGHVSQVTADDGVVTTIGSYESNYETPDASIENKTFSAGFKAEVDGTAHTVETEGQIGPVYIEGTRKVGTANANAVLEVRAVVDGLKSNLNVEASLGAEVMGVEAKGKGSMTFSTQGYFDKIADVYNATVDPVVERIVGHDVPDMEAFDLPEVLDREITISGHVETGLGVSAKYSFAGNLGRTDDRSDGVFSLHGAKKMGIGPVIGVGASIVID